MAIYHLTVKALGRSGGHKIVACAAYRSGSKLVDNQYDMVHDYTRKSGVVHSEILAPANAPDWVGDREALWNEVERVENKSTRRSTARLAREIEVALPRELTEEQNLGLVRGFLKEQVVDRGMIADFAIHQRDAADGGTNPHLHVLVSMRTIGPGGFGLKDRSWNDVELVEDWREAWAEHGNRALAEAGSDARIDHRTLEAQGILRAPSVHMGPEATYAQEKGEPAQRVQPDRFDLEMAIFDQQVEMNGYLDLAFDLDPGTDPNPGWYERMGAYANKVSSAVREWVDWGTEKVQGWADWIRSSDSGQSRTVDR